MAHGYKHLIHSWLVLTDEAGGQQHLLILAEETALAILEGTGEDGLAPFIAVRKGQCCLKAQTLVLHGALRIETIPPSGRYLFDLALQRYKNFSQNARKTAKIFKINSKILRSRYLLPLCHPY